MAKRKRKKTFHTKVYGGQAPRFEGGGCAAYCILLLALPISAAIIGICLFT